MGTHCEIKRHKDKSTECGGSGQGKKPWEVGRYATVKFRDGALSRRPDSSTGTRTYIG